MSTLSWEIYTRVGAGPMDFSMNKTKIRDIIGPPVKERRLSDGEWREFRRMKNSTYDLILQYDEEILSGILFPFVQNDVKICGDSVFKDDTESVIQAIKSENGGYYTYYEDEDLFFRSLNIILHDFLSDENTNKGASVWSDAAYAQTISIVEANRAGREVR